MKTSIATVCLSGSLIEAPCLRGRRIRQGRDLRAGPDRQRPFPEEIRSLARRLGLSLDLYQPLRDLEGVDEATFSDNCRRAAATFATAQRLGIDTVLVCSNVATATVDSDEVSADQLRRIGDIAAGYGIRIAFEALAWGASSTTTGGPGAWSRSRTTRPSGCAWTVSTCSPGATIPPRSNRFPPPRSSTCSWPMHRR